MRGVEKSGPPGGNVAGNSGEITWEEAEAALRQVAHTLTPKGVRQEHFDPLSKPKIGTRLLAEQRQLCVFCERPLDLTSVDATGQRQLHIAHWVPINVARDRALDWDNLYASCDHPETCDRRQGRRELGLPEPGTLPYERALDFGASGAVRVSPAAEALLSPKQLVALQTALGDPELARAVPIRGDPRSTLNINHESLQTARSAALDGFRESVRRRFPEGRPAPAQLQALIDELLQAPVRRSFVSVQLAWLQRLMRRSPPPAP